MEQYISKSVLLAEIRKYINNAETYLKYHHNRNDKSVYAFEQEKLAMCELLSSLDTLEVQEIGVDLGDLKGDKSAKCIIDTKTLEVKEADLEEEIDKELDEEWYGEYIEHDKFRKSAKHFFELGMQVSNKVKKGK